jgi:putative transposase
MTHVERRKMIEFGHTLSLVSQCELLSLQRSILYYQPVEMCSQDLILMSLMDKQYLRTPFYGYRKMTVFLQKEGYKVNHKRVRRLMRVMGIEAIYARQNTSKPNKEHKIYPYLLKNVSITKINQVWATDITYVPMQRGFMYLMAVLDLYSRYVLAWDVSNSMDAEWCTKTLNLALEKHGTPEIFNTDQGSQFTSEMFVNTLLDKGIQPSMDGKGRAIDNIFVERLWRSVKYEDIYLWAYSDGWQLELGLKKYFTFYNYERPHQSLEYKTPNEVYQSIGNIKN